MEPFGNCAMGGSPICSSIPEFKSPNLSRTCEPERQRCFAGSVGQTSGARFVRVGAVLALLACGSIDQVHYYLALHSDDLADLKRAAALAPYDAPLQARVARASLEAGKSQDSWRHGNMRLRPTLLILRRERPSCDTSCTKRGWTWPIE